MSGETSITIIGNLTADPELRTTPAGARYATFTIASTPRTFDNQAKEWVDGETLFLPATIWRDAADHAARSLTKGARVIATGLLKSRTYETKAGEKRTVIELQVEEIGASLRYGALNLAQGGRAEDVPGAAVQRESHPADSLSISAREYADDDPWFGLHTNPSGRINLPGADPDPTH